MYVLFLVARDLAERSHGFSIVVGNKSLKKRNGSLDLLFRQETDDTDLCKTSVVEFLNKSFGLLFLGFSSGETKGIEKVEGDRVGDELGVIGELGEGTGLSTAHVMVTGRLREPFQESNEKDDLPLGGIRKSIPLLRRGSSGEGVRRSISGDREGEVNSVGLDDVSDEGSHGNTAVLDLSMTQEGDGGFVGLTPDGGGGQFQRIVILQNRVGLLSESHEVLLGGKSTVKRSGGAGILGRGESSGRAGEKGSKGELHGDN
mmetsp:Transcript_24676/g.34827  ORF Transcript_24676/g.34827 Transcript_24676/m.34827 type:complete len:259 (-) Transcript_24676:66-842(-)